MNYRSIIIFASAAVLCMSCAKEMNDSQPEGKTLTIEAYSADAQKTTLVDGGQKVFWEGGDQISVFYEEINLKFSSLNPKPTQNGTFISDKNLIMGFTEDSDDLCLIGLYPYNEFAEISGDVIKSYLPEIQQGRAGSFAQNANVSIGKSNTTRIGFYNVTGGIRFSVTAEGVKKAVFKANGGEQIAGAYAASVAGSHPVITGPREGSTSVITLTAPAGQAFVPGQWYYISALPCTLANGFTLTLYQDDYCAEVVSKSSATITANTFGSLANVDEGIKYKSLGHKIDWKARSASGNWAELIDSDCSTTWKSGDTKTSSEILLDLQASWTIDRIILAQSYDNMNNGTAPRKLKVEAGNSMFNLTTVLEDQELVMNCYTQGYWFKEPVNARYIQITFSDPATPGKAIQFAEIDLGGPEYQSGNCAGDAVLPSLVNNCAPWEWDHSQDMMWTRFFPMLYWTHENTNNISCDAPDNTGNGTFVLFAFPQAGYESVAPNVKNGKIFQTLTLLPGDYCFRVSLPKCDNSAQYHRAHAVVAKGSTLTDFDTLESNPKSDPNYLSSIVISQNDVINIEKDVNFHLNETATVSMGFTYETWAPTGNYTQCYINWMSFMYTPLK